MTGRFAEISDIPSVESFVLMSVGEDRETVELRRLLDRRNITLSGLQTLLLSVTAVVSAEMRDILEDRSSPIVVAKKLAALRNSFTKELLEKRKKDGQVAPSPPPEVKFESVHSGENVFLSPDMAEMVPSHQLIVNPGLAPADAGAVGVEVRENGVSTFSPVFTVANADWRPNLKLFFSVLIRWVGSKSRLEDLILRTPTGAHGRDVILRGIKEECRINLLAPRCVSVCEVCGLRMEYNRFLTAECARVKAHERSHKKKRGECVSLS